MRHFAAAALAAALLGVSSGGSAAESQPIAAFARLPQIRNVTISPDGARVAFITAMNDRSVALILERNVPDKTAAPIVASEPGKYDIRWCNWANNTRLLCGLTAMATEAGHVYPISRLVAVNADGTGMKLLIQNTRAGGAQFHDRILDWTPDEPDTVLIELDDNVNSFPTVFELNVNTGSRITRAHERPPIRSFTTDARGNVRLGEGYGDRGTDIHYFAHVFRHYRWRTLGSYQRHC